MEIYQQSYRRYVEIIGEWDGMIYVYQDTTYVEEFAVIISIVAEIAIQNV